MNQNLENLRALPQEEAAALLNLKPKTLEAWRYAGRGPRFVKFGRLVRYRVRDLEEFMNQQTVNTELGA